MKPLGTQLAEAERWEYMHHKVGYKDEVLPKEKSVKKQSVCPTIIEFQVHAPDAVKHHILNQ